MVLDLFSSIDFYWGWFSSIKMLVWFFSVSWVILILVSNSFYSRVNAVFGFLVDLFMMMTIQNVHYSMKGMISVLVSFFIFMFLSKFWGMKFYMFGWTPHMLIIFPMTLFMWMSLQVSNCSNNFISYFAHLTPMGGPTMLTPILKIFEFISKLIRPLTLALRLGINMTTGHMLLSLLSTINCSIYFNCFYFSVFIGLLMAFYMLFELGVSFMQGFVFSLLISQYFEEHSV